MHLVLRAEFLRRLLCHPITTLLDHNRIKSIHSMSRYRLSVRPCSRRRVRANIRLRPCGSLQWLRRFRRSIRSRDFRTRAYSYQWSWRNCLHRTLSHPHSYFRLRPRQRMLHGRVLPRGSRAGRSRRSRSRQTRQLAIRKRRSSSQLHHCSQVRELSVECSKFTRCRYRRTGGRGCHVRRVCRPIGSW
mgnify:CR=1 FL=1